MVAAKYSDLDTLSRVVEGLALRSHSNRFHPKDGTLVLIPTPPPAGRDEVRENLFLSKGRGFFLLMTLRLTTEQIDRYSRQIMIPDIGGSGQIRLRKGRVLVIGVGALGSPAAFYLTAAGIGTLGLVDSDRVEFSNLQRQILYSTSDVGREKVESAKEKLNRLNPEVEIRSYPVRLNEGNAAEIFAPYDFIIDGSDNFSTKFLVNDIAVNLGKPFSHAGVVRLLGQTMTVVPGKSACYRCLFQAPPLPGEVLNCEQAGILGAVAGAIGSIQAAEAIKYFVGMEDELLVDRLLTVDGKEMKFRTVQVERNPGCTACGKQETRESKIPSAV